MLTMIKKFRPTLYTYFDRNTTLFVFVSYDLLEETD